MKYRNQDRNFETSKQNSDRSCDFYAGEVEGDVLKASWNQILNILKKDDHDSKTSFRYEMAK